MTALVCLPPAVAWAEEPDAASPHYDQPEGALVLRRQVSVPLEALVEPLDLAHWATADGATQSTPAAHQPRATDDPFVDDPEPAEGTLSLSDLLGLFGRALRPSVPTPSWHTVRDRLADVPLPLAQGGAPGREAEAGAGASAAADDESDFGVVPAQFEAPAAEAEEPAPASESAPADDDDPFAF